MHRLGVLREVARHGSFNKTVDLLRRYAEPAGFEPRISCSATDYFFAQSLVTAGVGAALIPEISLTRDPDVIAIPLEPPSPSRFIGIATSRRHRGPAQPYVDALCTLLSDGHA
ncbi:LysR substrate-binding domain-containing protein [Microbispora rosea]|uniref:LysR substrate-binding domain-containing protein n=1 Tax=Microbispora rosea TaxID=58117 RepID=UPI003424794B